MSLPAFRKRRRSRIVQQSNVSIQQVEQFHRTVSGRLTDTEFKSRFARWFRDLVISGPSNPNIVVEEAYHSSFLAPFTLDHRPVQIQTYPLDSTEQLCDYIELNSQRTSNNHNHNSEQVNECSPFVNTLLIQFVLDRYFHLAPRLYSAFIYNQNGYLIQSTSRFTLFEYDQVWSISAMNRIERQLHWSTGTILLSFVLQILLQLEVLQQSCSFMHVDLKPNKIRLVPTESKDNNVIRLTSRVSNVVYTLPNLGYNPVIEGFELSRIKLNDHLVYQPLDPVQWGLSQSNDDDQNEDQQLDHWGFNPYQAAEYSESNQLTNSYDLDVLFNTMTHLFHDRCPAVQQIAQSCLSLEYLKDGYYTTTGHRLPLAGMCRQNRDCSIVHTDQKDPNGIWIQGHLRCIAQSRQSIQDVLNYTQDDSLINWVDTFKSWQPPNIDFQTALMIQQANEPVVDNYTLNDLIQSNEPKQEVKLQTNQIVEPIAEQEAQESVESKNSNTIVQKTYMLLDPRDWRIVPLSQYEWLNDSEIASTLQALLDRHPTVNRIRFLYPMGSYEFENLLNRGKSAFKRFDDQLLVYIVSREQSHWTLVALDPLTHHLFYFDSLCCYLLPATWKRLLEEIDYRDILVSNYAVQDDGSNCGVWCLAVAEQLLQRQSLFDGVEVRDIFGQDLSDYASDYILDKRQEYHNLTKRHIAQLEQIE